MSDLIHNFGLNGKMLLVQAVNFFILLGLLSKFAYQPILAILKKRKEEIRKGLLYTEQAEKKIREIDVLKEETLQGAREQALTIVVNAEAVGIRRKEEIMEEAHRKVEGVIGDAKRIIQEERARSEKTLYRDAEDLVRMGIAKVIGALPPEEKNRVLMHEALKELRKTFHP